MTSERMDEAFGQVMKAAMSYPDLIEHAIIVLIGPQGQSGAGSTLTADRQINVLRDLIKQLETRETELVWVNRQTGDMVTEKPGKAN